MLPTIPATINQHNYLAIWLCLVRQTCYSCLMSNAEQKWGGEREITPASHLCPISCKAPGEREREKKMFVMSKEPSWNLTSRGGVLCHLQGRDQRECVSMPSLILVLALYGFMCISNGFKRLPRILRLFTQPGSPDLTLTGAAHFTEASWRQRVPVTLAQAQLYVAEPLKHQLLTWLVLSWLVSMSTWHGLESERREPQLRKCLHNIKL